MSDTEWLDTVMSDMGVKHDTVCARCLRTFEDHVKGHDCGTFTPCVEQPTAPEVDPEAGS